MHGNVLAFLVGFMFLTSMHAIAMVGVFWATTQQGDPANSHPYYWNGLPLIQQALCGSKGYFGMLFAQNLYICILTTTQTLVLDFQHKLPIFYGSKVSLILSMASIFQEFVWKGIIERVFGAC